MEMGFVYTLEISVYVIFTCIIYFPIVVLILSKGIYQNTFYENATIFIDLH